MKSTKQMISSLNETVVAILKDGSTYQARIIHPDIPGKTESNPNEQIVFTRSFPDMIDAIGYCTAINMLSNASIKRVIAKKSKDN